MKIKTTELQGKALNWAVAKCQGATDLWFDSVGTYWLKLNGKDIALSSGWARSYLPSTDPSQAYPIIEQERIAVIFGPEWTAVHHKRIGDFYYGATLLVAAMRCYVASKLGDEVDVPEGLL